MFNKCEGTFYASTNYFNKRRKEIMGFMQKVVATIATKYGVVTEGKYEGAVIALGNDPNGKVEKATQFKQIIFIEGNEEKARFNIDEDIKILSITGETENGLSVVGLFSDDERFALEVKWKKDVPKAVKIASIMGSVFTNGMYIEQSDEEKYHNIKVFMYTVVGKLSPDSLQFLLDFYKQHNILDEANQEILNFCLDRYK